LTAAAQRRNIRSMRPIPPDRPPVRLVVMVDPEMLERIDRLHEGDWFPPSRAVVVRGLLAKALGEGQLSGGKEMTHVR
jgi:hypothetical protein